LDQCEAYGVPQALATSSLIDAVKKPNLLGSYSKPQQKAFRRRRILAQIHMGLRQLLRASKGQRKHIKPAADWPEIKLD